jgi:transposase
MYDYRHVRRLREVEGLTLRAISRQTGIHRTTIGKILEEGAPPGYQRSQPAKQPILGPFIPIIDRILEADKQIPPKQRHTAHRICQRLQDEYGYPGKYTQVREYVRQAKGVRAEAYIPLEFDPGTAQVDWGEAWVKQEGQWLKTHLFVMTQPFSDARFVACFPSQEGQYFYEGHRRAFEYFGGVPRVIIYDNLKTAVFKIRRHGGRDLNPTFKDFCAHYLFEPRFCNVASGNEKGHVEGGVKWTRRNFWVPVPRLDLWEDFNRDLVQKCRRYYGECLRGHTQTIGERLAEEQHTLLPIPKATSPMFQPQETKVRSLCLVRFETNDYSVPCRYAHHPVTVRATLDEVRIFHQHECIALHTRSFEKERTFYEPWHYLPLIEQRPRALDDAAPLKRLELDECFHLLRRRLEAAANPSSKGTREYIRVLQLLEHHPLRDLTRAVQRAVDLGVHDQEAVKNLLLCPPERNPTPLDLSGRSHLAAYHLPRPHLAAYTSLTDGGLS